MKRVVILLIFLLIAIQGWCTYDVCVGGVYYTVYYGHAHITAPGYSADGLQGYNGYTQPTGDIVIPDSISYNGNTYPVDGIGDHAFHGCTGITSIVLPDAITQMYFGTFKGCSGLLSVSLPSGLTNLPNDTFSECSSLTNISLPNGITSIGSLAFYGCSSLTSISLPDGLVSIGYGAFESCSSLTSVVLPEGIHFIPSSLFLYCSALTTVHLPNSMTSIGSGAFQGCPNLAFVNLSDSLSYVASSAFDGNISLTSIAVGNDTLNIATNDTTRGHVWIDVPGGNPWNHSVIAKAEVLGYGDTINFSGWSNGCTSWYDTVFLTSDSNISAYFYRVRVNAENYSILNVGHQRIGAGVEEIWAIESAGVLFDHWSNGSTANPDTLYLTGDTSISAHFIFCTLTADADRGQVFQNKIGYLTEEISATSGNYHFDHWSNGSTANPDTIYLTGDTAITAYFIGCTLNTNLGSNHNYVSRRKLGERLEGIRVMTEPYGYHFDHWSTGSIAITDTIHLTGDTTITAYFERNQYSLTTMVNDSTLGYVSLPNGDTALYGNRVVVVAHPIEHYHVDRWMWMGMTIYGFIGYETLQNGGDTLWYQLYTDDTVVCYFTIDEYTITVEPNDNMRGAVTGGGVFTYGTPCIVQAYPYSGYTFDHWSNGVTDNPYAFPATEDVELQAIFLAPDEVSYTVTAVSDSPTMGSATVNGLSSVTVMNGEEVTLAATPNQGYRFLHWQDNDTNSERTVMVISDSVFTAYFETVGGTEGIGGVGDDNIRIYSTDGHIVVEGTTDEVRVFDIVGRRVRWYAVGSDDNEALPSGVYMVKVGNRAARKVVVIR